MEALGQGRVTVDNDTKVSAFTWLVEKKGRRLGFKKMFYFRGVVSVYSLSGYGGPVRPENNSLGFRKTFGTGDLRFGNHGGWCFMT